MGNLTHTADIDLYVSTQCDLYHRLSEALTIIHEFYDKSKGRRVNGSFMDDMDKYFDERVSDIFLEIGRPIVDGVDYRIALRCQSDYMNSQVDGGWIVLDDTSIGFRLTRGEKFNHAQACSELHGLRAVLLEKEKKLTDYVDNFATHRLEYERLLSRQRTFEMNRPKMFSNILNFRRGYGE